MVPFRFELAAIESIAPWGEPSNPDLSWFALTLGDFWIDLGRDELFRYTPIATPLVSDHGPSPETSIGARTMRSPISNASAESCPLSSVPIQV